MELIKIIDPSLIINIASGVCLGCVCAAFVINFISRAVCGASFVGKKVAEYIYSAIPRKAVESK